MADVNASERATAVAELVRQWCGGPRVRGVGRDYGGVVVGQDIPFRAALDGGTQSRLFCEASQSETGFGREGEGK